MYKRNYKPASERIHLGRYVTTGSFSEMDDDDDDDGRSVCWTPPPFQTLSILTDCKNTQAE